MKVADGLLNAKRPKPATPPPSPEGFKWPDQREADDEVAEKIAASLQELLPKKGWKHTDLARELWGTMGPHGAPRNVAPARRYVLAELPIPNEQTAGYIAQLLDVPMARLLKPVGKFDPDTDMIRDRSPNGTNKAKAKGKKTKKKAKAGKTASGRDREKQREYNEKYRRKQKRLKAQGDAPKRKYTRRTVEMNGSEEGPGWVLAEGVEPPTYTITSVEDHAGHVKLEMAGVMPHKRAMAILHMLQHGKPPE